ncbi:hypothetical protein LTR53_001522 [Teratosphaeriaceae sp. CCFEE 6253]|nr:hypothetical protein LTR53_001522 [Teratosphaeriaceae sp. CCFEE 6253]
MSQHDVPYIPPPPPPTPPSAGYAASQAPGEYYPHRRARPAVEQPPNLTTSFPRPAPRGSSASSTPRSGGHGTPFPFSPSTPAALNPRLPSALNPASLASPPRTPNAAMEPYNPRQWTQSRQVSGSQMVFGRAGAPSVSASGSSGSSREVTGMEESMPSPPPPYSPDATGGVRHASVASPVLDSGAFMASPLPAESIRGSPLVRMSPSFPPPPSAQSSRHRERSASGLTGPRALLAGLRGKQPVPAEPQPGHNVPVLHYAEVQPPTARRAASTGHLQSMSGSIAVITPSASERSSPVYRWQPGMPLPGPPPNPPLGARSQSLNRFPTSSSSYSDASDRILSRPATRWAAAPSSLGVIPPTPAGWVDGQDTPLTDSYPEVQSHSPYQPLRINTGTAREAFPTRRPATRESSAQGLRERRSLSRRGKDRSGDPLSPSSSSDHSKRSGPGALPIDGVISRRREHRRDVSGYADLLQQVEPDSQVLKAAPVHVQAGPTVPASILTPPYTPAVNQSDDMPGKAGLHVPTTTKPNIRPVSSLLHTPNDDAAVSAPLTPGRPESAGSIQTSARLDAFSLQAIERHRAFIEKEATAASDEERLELFANFMVHESRLRRDRYQTAYNAMAGDVVDLTRDMWRSYTKGSKRAVTPSTSMSSFDPTVPSWASDGQPSSAQGGMPSSASSMGDFTPATDAASVGDVQEAFERSESRQWTESFKPTLSPIPSMAQSTVPDEESSRGRAPSRWWETSNSGSGSIGRPDRMEKTNRETKYMGVKAAQLQESTEPSPTLSRQSGTPGASKQSFVQSPGDYPPEKSGWHESVEFDTPMATPARTATRKSSTASTGSPLDISRLVTLPPPYPRHHPAVNNHHPALSELRNQHRVLADHGDTQRIKDGFMDGDFAIRQQQKEMAKERRGRLHSSMQMKIADGSLSFAAAGQGEKDFDIEEAERGKAYARSNFERFETNVAQPLNTLLTDKIRQADACILQLKANLEDGFQVSDPNQAQEEGDEQPERLEKLTLLKWLFEAREQLHKEMFDLHAQRSEQYSEVILTPYRIQRSQGKIDEALAFFAKDSRQRQMAFAKDCQKRLEELQATMERNVSRGVEDQLSAFWDIAPSLLEVAVRVPEDLGGFEVQVPATEYEENLAYAEFPLQYLYSLLSHAEKSAYQFIESQTNLLCLLHEVRTAATKSNLRLLELECAPSTPAMTSPGFTSEVALARREAEERLTTDLKEKVGEVDSQWKEALGAGLAACKSRVREYLEVVGGWEDGLEA